MNRQAKTGRPKKDFLAGGLDEHCGFWDPVMTRIGARIVKGKYMTLGEWRTFCGPDGEWTMLKSIACKPAFRLLGADDPANPPRFPTPEEIATAPHLAWPDPKTWRRNRLKDAEHTRRWLCERIAVHPIAVPLVLGWIREEVATFSPVERWLFYNAMGRRCAYSAGELAAMFTRETGFCCSGKEVTQAHENICRRIAKHPSV